MSKLMTDEELIDKLYEDLNLKQFDPRDSAMIVDYLLDLFQEQKRAHGDMVIGHDELTTEGEYFDKGIFKLSDAGKRNNLRAEQRERNAS